jgi:hypothetical protein
MKWRPIDEARMIAKEMSREYRRPDRDQRRINKLADEIRALVPEDQGALVETPRGFKVKIWSGSPRDRKPERHGRQRREAA